MRHWSRALTYLVVSCMLFLRYASPAGAVQVGAMAPDFNLTATIGDKVSLGAYRGKQPVVVFFYIAAFGGT